MKSINIKKFRFGLRLVGVAVLTSLLISVLSLAQAAQNAQAAPGNPAPAGSNPPMEEIRDKLYSAAVERNIPPEILYGIAYQESRWAQFDANGDPIISFDGGIGIMQVTSYGGYDVERLKNDIDYNIMAGADILLEKWSWTPSIGDNNKNCYENWFYAVWAYNGWVAYNDYPYTVYNHIAAGPEGWWTPVYVTPVPQEWLVDGIGVDISTPEPSHYFTPPEIEGIREDGNYFTSYDDQAGADWVLAANSSAAADDAAVDLSIEGEEMDLAPFTAPGKDPGEVAPGDTLVARYENLAGGPVAAGSPSNTVVSQRVLIGDSVEEVLGVKADKLASHYYWPWYDQSNPGFQDWVLVANPNSESVYYEVSLSGTMITSGFIAAGKRVAPSFPGLVGGPLEVRAWTGEDKENSAQVVASQRVLAGNGTAFNEAPGISEEELSDRYMWSWYDQQSEGALNRIMAANHNPDPVYYEISINGIIKESGDIDPGQSITPTFDGVMGGPVELRTWTDESKGETAKVVASQRVIWGPSFSETPGYAVSALKSNYIWTWYDNQSPGSQNWVLILNPNSTYLYYELRIGGELKKSGNIAPGQHVTPSFMGLMDGPVEVSAWTDSTKTGPANVITSQRLLWNGFFNEVLGTPQDPLDAPANNDFSVFPDNNIWNTRVDGAPVDTNSEAYIQTIGSEETLFPDFGSGTWDGGPIGIPFVEVGSGQPFVDVSFDYDDESDPGGYPVPPDAPVEGGSDSDGDRHVIVVDKDNNMLYELYAAYPQPDGSWHAGSGAIFDLSSNNLRPDGWTSADAAGLPIYPGLVRYDELVTGEINHAIRFTVPQTRDDYIWPARHFASYLSGLQYPPMGQRFRLKADYDISSFSPEIQVILTAMKQYGIILADNGSAMFVSGAPDERWDNSVLNELKTVTAADFEAVDVSSFMVDPDSAQAETG